MPHPAREDERTAVQQRLQDAYLLQECLKPCPQRWVWRALSRTGQPCVVKWADRASLLPEYSLLQQLDLPQIPRLIEFLDFEGKSCLIRTFVDGVPLSTLKEPDQILRAFQSLARLLGKLHKAGHWRLDLKPGHILVAEESHLIDLGGGDFTPLYASPELLGLLPGNPGPATDFYSLGLALLETVLGHTWLKDTGDLYASVLALEVPPLDPKWPRGLRELLHALLQKRAPDRLQDASRLASWLGSLAEGEGLAELPFLGRRAELAEAEKLFRETGPDESLWMFVQSPPGGGKSRFVRELARKLGWGVCEARAVTMQSPESHLFFRQLAHSMPPDLELPLEWADSAAWRVTATQVPELQRLLACQTLDAQGPLLLASMGDALGRLLTHLFAHRPSTLLFLDDLQWADSATLRVLKELQGLPGLKVVAASRLGPAGGELSWHASFSLTPLGIDDIAELGDVDAEGLLASTLGSPLALQERVARVVGDASTGELSTVLEAAQSLPESTRLVLGVAALIGKSFRFDQLSSLGLEGVVEALERACKSWILLGHRGQFQFRHDLLRDRALSHFTREEQADWHGRLAQTFRGQPAEAFHLHNAGLREQARPVLLAAARQETLRGSYSSAADFYSMYEAEPGEADVIIEHAEVLLNLGDPVACLRILDSQTGEVEVRALTMRLEAYNLQSRFSEATDCCGRVLATLGIPPLRFNPRLIANWVRAWVGLSKRDARKILNYLQVVIHDSVRASRMELVPVALLPGLFLALRWSDTEEASFYFSLLSAVGYASGLRSVGGFFEDRALKGLTHNTSPGKLADSLAPMALRFLGRRESQRHVEHLQVLLPLFQWGGLLASYCQCLIFLGLNLFHQGRLSELEEVCRDLSRATPVIRDPRMTGGQVHLQALLHGAVPQSVLRETLSLPTNDPFFTVHLAIAATLTGRRNGDLREALELFDKANPGPIANAVIQWAWEATACRWEADRISRLSPRRRLLLERGQSLVTRGLRAAHTCLMYLPHIQREEAWLAIYRGQEEEARRLFHQSIDEANSNQLHLQAAWSQWDLARLLGSLGIEGAEKQEVEARMRLQAMGAGWLVQENDPEAVSLETLVAQSAQALEGSEQSQPGPTRGLKYLEALAWAVSRRKEREDQRDQARLQWSAQRARHQAFFNHGPVGFMVGDETGLENCNRRALELVQGKEEEIFVAARDGAESQGGLFFSAQKLLGKTWVSVTPHDPRRGRMMQELHRLEGELLHKELVGLARCAPPLEADLAAQQVRVLRSLEQLRAAIDQREQRLETVLDFFRERGLEMQMDLQDWPAGPVLNGILVGTIREGLNNVLKHSGQTRAEIQLKRHPRGWRLRLRNPSRSIVALPPKGRIGFGMGLDSLRWQALCQGGLLTVDTHEGFELCLDVPNLPLDSAPDAAS